MRKNTQSTETDLEMTDMKILTYVDIKSAVIHSPYVQNEGENINMMGETEDIKSVHTTSGFSSDMFSLEVRTSVFPTRRKAEKTENQCLFWILSEN